MTTGTKEEQREKSHAERNAEGHAESILEGMETGRMSNETTQENNGMKNRVIKYTAYAARWFDRVNGNTYHSVRVTRHRDGKTIVCPMQYGYGDHYRQTALVAMARAKWFPVKYRGRHQNGSPLAMGYEMENNYPILWNVSDGLKRDCVANGQE